VSRPKHASAVALLSLLVLACSPEARRVRDGGPGADPGNKDLVAAPRVDPRPADTTLWPGRAPAPVDRLAHGEIPPPTGVTSTSAPAVRGQTPVTPNVPATAAEQQAFNRGTSANPRRPSSRDSAGKRAGGASSRPDSGGRPRP
jgi:hypothetical protein